MSGTLFFVGYLMTFLISDYIALDGRLMNDESERIWKEMAGGGEENHEKQQSG
jgi:hypothetical protein